MSKEQYVKLRVFPVATICEKVEEHSFCYLLLTTVFQQYFDDVTPSLYKLLAPFSYVCVVCVVCLFFSIPFCTLPSPAPCAKEPARVCMRAYLFALQPNQFLPLSLFLALLPRASFLPLIHFAHVTTPTPDFTCSYHCIVCKFILLHSMSWLKS